MSAPITDDLLSRVLSQYSLADPRVIDPMEASVRNHNFLVEDAEGRRYVLRRYRRNPDQRRIEFQLRFQHELYRREFPTSEVVKTMSGGLFVTSEGEPWVLFTYVEGSEYDFTRVGQVAEAGRRLAEFHTLTESTPSRLPSRGCRARGLHVRPRVPGSRRIRSDAARLFLDEYDRQRPLSREERAALPMMVVLAWVPSPAYHAYLQRDGEDTAAFFRHYVSVMRDLQGEAESLGSVLTGGPPG